MQYGLRKSLEEISFELKGIRNVLASMWYSRYQNGETDQLSPDIYSDEYITTEECGRRLSVSDQTIRNWILAGKKDPSKGWTQGVHYVNVMIEKGKKPLIRIPWNRLVASFSSNPEINFRSFQNKMHYHDTKANRAYFEGKKRSPSQEETSEESL